MADTSPFNRSAQHDAKRAAILSQAARLFNSKGSRATTLKDIAESLGLTKTSLYYYVKTKEDLIYQCYMAALTHHHRCLDEIEDSTDRPDERLSSFMRQHFDNWLAAREARGPHIAALLEIASLKGEHRENVETAYIEMFKRVRQYLRDGICAGTFRPIHENSATRALFGSMEWAFHWLHQVPQDDVADCASRASDILAHGLAAGSAEFEPAILSFDDATGQPLQGFNREEQNRLKQEAFYKTGAWFFNKQGFNGTSLDEIAERLNVSKGAFYYHIKNKEDLLFNCYLRSTEIMQRIHSESAASGENGLRKLEQSCRRAFHAQNSEEGPLIRYNTITALPVPRRRKVLQRTDETNQMFREFMEQGIEDGSVREVDTFVAMNLFTGAMNAAMDIKLWRRVDDIDAAAIDYFDIFFNGLLPRA